ncbi:hypothetical protein WR25_07131 isoform D [Diploscapter pachys]|uniref:Uncharacterized protein n=1 Tax=Diploscapter pachys TaxID=2018661 RepID=A0A2A2JFI5_9BILA|nr:hypothetical protein WR25_07131 isoform D [Diploscapter pachys]
MLAQPNELPLSLELEQVYNAAISACRLVTISGPTADHQHRCFVVAGTSAGEINAIPCDSASAHCILMPTRHPNAISAIAAGCLTRPAKSQPNGMKEIISISSDGTLFCTALTTQNIASSVFYQIIQSNVNAAHIMDVDKDGWDELIVSMTDRVVRTFRYETDKKRLTPIHKWDVPSQITAFAIGESSANLCGVEMWLSQVSFLIISNSKNKPDRLSDGRELLCEFGSFQISGQRIPGQRLRGLSHHALSLPVYLVGHVVFGVDNHRW